MNSDLYSTSDLMKLFGLGRNTLRLYEEMGLLAGMERSDSGYRQFTQRHVDDLKFVLEAKKVGFTLAEIQQLLSSIRNEQSITCGTMSLEISQKVSEIDKELERLQSKKTFLEEFLNTCGSRSEESKCDVIGNGFSTNACCD